MYEFRPRTYELTYISVELTNKAAEIVVFEISR